MSELKSKHDGKTSKVIELRQQEKTWTQISKELDIPPRSLYNLRHTEGFMAVANEIWMDVMVGLKKQWEAGETSPYHLDQAIKNSIKIFMLMSGTSLEGLIGSEAKTTGCNDLCPHYTKMHDERSKEFNDLFDIFITVGAIDPWQLQRFRLFMLKRPWRHITKENWDK